MAESDTKSAEASIVMGPDRAEIVFGLGGNQGDVRAAFRVAIRGLESELGTARVAGLYRSAPISAIAQADFLNTAVAFDWPTTRLDEPADTEARRWVGLAKRLERAAGRDHDPGSAGPRDAPRPLDIDLLLLGEHRVDLPALHEDGDVGAFDPWPGAIRVPHARILERRFVLRPLLDLLGDRALPIGDGTVTPSAALEQLGEEQRVEPISW